MTTDIKLGGQPPMDPNQVAFGEWWGQEGIGVAEFEVLNGIATLGVASASNALYKAGWEVGRQVILRLLEAAFQLGRAVGRREIKNRVRPYAGPPSLN